jgi:hypothetical protein
MDNSTSTPLGSRSTTGSLLSLTPFERWQLEKYGEYYKEKESEPQDDMDEMLIMQELLHNH